MEAIITVVGFLGAGKTTLLKNLTSTFIAGDWNPFIILNDYENANLDVQQFLEQMDSKQVMALNGSCICCSGIGELRYYVNSVPERTKGITLIEANGTSDACSLMGFLGVGLKDRFLPPIQISVVDVKNWQRREEHNELEANQIQVSSLIVLTHLENTSEKRRSDVLKGLEILNPSAKIVTMDELDINLLPQLSPSENEAQKLDHLKAHWASCSTDLPKLPDSNCIHHICDALPKSILRVKGCTRIGKEDHYTYFERTPDGKVRIRPFYGVPTTGSKLLAVGPGSDPVLLEKVIEENLISEDLIN
ncbi:MAG: GTP-binding protein [Bacteroidota bacterium]